MRWSVRPAHLEMHCHMLKTAEIDRKSAGNPGLSEEVQTAVKAELCSMLEAPIFAHSSRCKRFLSHVVNQTLQGRADELKERTIGVSAFDRPSDYDTAEDPIVRVTANEVRKRIGQFYQDSPNSHTVQIEIPKGAYIPEFRILPAKRNGSAGMMPISAPWQSVSPANGSKTSPDFHENPQNRASLNDSPPFGSGLVESKNLARRKLWSRIALLAILISAGATAANIWMVRSQRSYPRIWDSFQHAKVPVLVCLGAHDIPEVSGNGNPDSDTFSNLVMHRQTIPIDDVSVITEVASLLGKQGVAFRVSAAGLTSLSDFRRQPVILIGAVDNIWTQRLTQALRYRLDVANSQAGQVPIATITDSIQPSGNSWTIDFSSPVSTWKSDYAIVARLDDPITGVPVLIDAGLGNDGSLAAAEFITSGASQSRLANDPLCRKKSNFEAIIETDIIGMRPGPPHLIRLECW